MSGFWSKHNLAVLVFAVAVCLWAVTGIPLAQAAQAEKSVVEETAPAKVKKEVVKEANPAAVSPKPAIPPAIEVEIQRSVNEVRKEVLDNRADNIGWWLTFITIVFGVLGIVVVFGGYLTFRNFQAEARRSADSAKGHAENAKKLVEEIEKESKEILEVIGREGQEVIQLIGERGKGLLQEIREYRDESKALLNETAESFANATEQEKQDAENVLEDPKSSPMEKAVAKALSFQEQGKKDEAIETWRGIANVTEGIDDDRAALAWFSVGFLFTQQGKHKEAIDAYSQSIDLNPNIPVPYNNRGAAKIELEQYEAAILDLNHAIHMNPSYAIAFSNRGNAKRGLRQYEAAIEDYEEALSLNSNNADVYNNRGVVKFDLEQYEAAIADYYQALRLGFDKAKGYYNLGEAYAAMGRKDEAKNYLTEALSLAQAAGNDKLAADAERELQKLDEQ